MVRKWLYILLSKLRKQYLKPQVRLLKRDSYLVMIKNSIGSNLWHNSYALVDGIKTDISSNGNTSCAFFVSSILKLFDLITKLHWTVHGVERDLKISGWKSVCISKNMPQGSILIWEKQGGHFHIGFYIGNKQAISIWTDDNIPIIRDWTFNGKRQIIRAYTKLIP